MKRLSIVLFLAVFVVEAHATALTCGKEFVAASDKSTAWNLSAIEASDAKQCQFTITGDEGHFVKISFENFIFNVGQKTTSCENSYVKVEGSVNGVKVEIAKLCTTAANKVFYSPGSKMEVNIQGEQALPTVKFNATYQSIESVESFCDESERIAQTNVSAVWSAPKKQLEDNMICVYKLVAKPNEAVKLIFDEIASLPNEASGVDKSQILIKLENLKGETQTSIANITVSGLQSKEYTSTEEIMVVTLFGIAGLQNPNKLFSAVYNSVANPICGPAVLQADLSTSTDWQIPLQTLVPDRKCIYTIQAQNSQTVELNITTLDLGKTNRETSCQGSYLQIVDIVDGKEQTIEEICDKAVPHLVSSTGSVMKVTLFGVSSLKQNALTATYRAIETCGAQPKAATEGEQWIDVYTKEGNIPQSQKCMWTITAPENKKVEVYLKDEGETSKKQCVSVTGVNEQVPVSICRKSNNNMATTTIPVTVKFKGPGQGDKYKNFRVYYKLAVESATDCGAAPKAATEKEQWIDVYTKSDNIPKLHKCVWTITAPEDKKVDVYLNVEEESSEEQCVVVTGSNEQNPERMCRKNHGNTATKTQPVTVKFEGPDEENAYKNFKVYYKLSFANHIAFSFANFLLSLFAILF